MENLTFEGMPTPRILEWIEHETKLAERAAKKEERKAKREAASQQKKAIPDHKHVQEKAEEKTEISNLQQFLF